MNRRSRTLDVLDVDARQDAYGLPSLSSEYRHSPREVFHAGGDYVIAFNGRRVTR